MDAAIPIPTSFTAATTTSSVSPSSWLLLTLYRYSVVLVVSDQTTAPSLCLVMLIV